jgi:hypothetical protein
MFNSLQIRSLIMYAICVPIAIFVGYQLATWDDMMSFGIMIVVLSMLVLPLLLKWHHFWLIAAWNTTAMVFFMPGRPSLALALTAASLLISVIQHAINQEPMFLPVPTIIWPLIFLSVVVLVTARFTGGIGLNVFGSANVGGRRYVWLLGAIVGYFALSSQRIPPEKAGFYATAFFLSPVTSAISDLTSFVGPSAIYYIFLLFPPNGFGPAESDSVVGPEQIERLGGVTIAATAVYSTMLAMYGIGGIFTLRKPWRAAIFMILLVLSMFGGFRSALICLALTLGIVFVLEGLLTSRLLPTLVCAGVVAAVALIPFTDRLPLALQRTLTVVPYLNLDEGAKRDADASTQWRLDMWKQVTPEIPHYLVLGKGYSINAMDLEKLRSPIQGDEQEAGSILSGDYHNGPLSVIMPFGIAGVIGFLWFIGAGIKVLYYNYKYGDPALRRINTFFLASFIAKAFMFFTIFGSLYSDMAIFTGLIGINVSLNGGMRQPVRVPKKRTSDAWKIAQARPAAVN